ncbi:MAG: DHH family phosphoesterase [Erysipelotrichaceae bacterium]|nr:DHH family phosphoesterase [Erysipelotrichaceae bacterium]
MNFKEKILKYYSLTEEEYQKLIVPVNELELPAPSLFNDMEKAKNIILNAIDNKEKIVIYGDYDCDGIMATSILVKCFDMLNYRVGYYIPSRYIDGYGLNTKRVEDFYKKGYKLIITVDNGIAQFEAIQKAYELGMKVIVTDHHEKQDKLPSCEAILHPIISNYGDIVCCGAYVSFMLATYLLGYDDEYLLSLASIATISDMMVLKAYNRDIVRLGISYLNKNNYYQFKLLSEDNLIDENVIGLKIAPKINAIGRMIENTSINHLVEFFVTNYKTRILQIYNSINEVNEKRKSLTKDQTNDVTIDETLPYISIVTNIKEGVIGLLANNLLNKYKKPTFVFTYDSHDKNVIKGSARSKNGFAINQFLMENKALFLTSGGHEQAGGLSLLKDNYDIFLSRLNDYALNNPFVEENKDFIDISITDINEDNYNFLRTLAPFGEGFKLPLLRIKNILAKSLTYSKSKLHILYNLSLNQKIMGFSYSENLISQYDYINLYGTLGYSCFNGKKSFDFTIKRITDNNDLIIEND